MVGDLERYQRASAVVDAIVLPKSQQQLGKLGVYVFEDQVFDLALQFSPSLCQHFDQPEADEPFLLHQPLEGAAIDLDDQRSVHCFGHVFARAAFSSSLREGSEDITGGAVVER